MEFRDYASLDHGQSGVEQDLVTIGKESTQNIDSQRTLSELRARHATSSSSRNKNALLHVFLINTFHTPVVLHWGFSSRSVTRPWPPRVKCEGSVKVYQLYVWHLKGLENPFDFKLPSSPTNYTYFQDFKFQKNLKKVWTTGNIQ